MMRVPSENIFYLDSNIIVAYYFEDDDANQNERILKCLNKISLEDSIILIASTWTLIEAHNAILKKISNKVDQRKMNGRIGDYERKKAHKFITNLWKNPTFDGIDFNIKKFNMDFRNEDYLHIEDFFGLVDDVAPLGNLRDALHCVIMNHFGIKKILTFNINDFKIFEDAMGDIEAINPDDIDKYIKRNEEKNRGSRMIHHPEIWGIIQTHMQRERWISLTEIYQMVERYGNLDVEDFEPQSPTSDIPKWKRNVRNVLQSRKGSGEIQWDEDANYLLP